MYLELRNYLIYQNAPQWPYNHRQETFYWMLLWFFTTVCLIGTVSDHEVNRYEAMMTRKKVITILSKLLHLMGRKMAPPIKNPVSAPDHYCYHCPYHHNHHHYHQPSHIFWQKVYCDAEQSNLTDVRIVLVAIFPGLLIIDCCFLEVLVLLHDMTQVFICLAA